MKTLLHLLLAVLFVASFNAIAAPVYEPLNAFVAGPKNPGNGKLLLHTDGNYYGLSNAGGAHGLGTVYRVTPAGEVTVLASLSQETGYLPAGPLASDGLGFLWAATVGGGANSNGTIFKVNVDTGVIAVVMESEGPISGLVSDGNGSFWGMIGSSVSKINMITGVVTKIASFISEGEEGLGVIPWLGLVGDGNGFLWGSTMGRQEWGTIFKVNIATGVVTSIYQFTGDFTGTGAVGTGQWATGALASDGAGFFWGTSTNNVFKIHIATGQMTPVVYFTDSEGAAPGGYSPGLVNDGNGYFWGINEVIGSGIIFKIHAGTGVLTRVFTFQHTNGSRPDSELVNDGNGFLWGTTKYGGAGTTTHGWGWGTVFKIHIATGVLTTMAELVQSVGEVTASHPAGGLVSDASGVLWGTTEDGGIGADGVGFGTIFKVQPDSGAVTKVLYFTNNSGPAKGNTPDGKLLDDGNGSFWGTTFGGGANNFGTVFKLKQNTGVLTTLREFTGITGTTKGLGPIAGLVSDGSGFVWGSTRSGGTNDFGTIFKVNTGTGALTTVVTFTGNSGIAKGKYPFGALISDGNGSFWGTTEQGGANNWGTVFKVNQSTGAVTTTVTFTGTAGAATGIYPDAGLVSDGKGFFWGTTYNGGTAGRGNVFKVRASTNAFTPVFSFTGLSGAFIGEFPTAGLTMGGDGNFWGTTRGQLHEAAGGTIFKVTPAGAFSHVFSFTGTSGSVPGKSPSLGSLLLHPDGNLYGTTYEGGVTPDGRPAGNGQIYRIRFGPTPVTQAATQVAATTATLRGTLNPNGVATAASFEWGTDPQLATFATAAAGTVGSGTSPVAVAADLTGLVTGDTYYFRVVGMNAENANPQRGVILGFTTQPLTPLRQWKLTHLGDADASDLDDLDQDGIVTLAEYGLNVLPGIPNGSPFVAERFSYPEGERLRVFVPRNPAHSDVTVTVQAAGSLSGPWSDLATSTLGAPFAGPGYVGGDSATPGVKTVEIRDTVNMAVAQARFIRVRVMH